MRQVRQAKAKTSEAKSGRHQFRQFLLEAEADLGELLWPVTSSCCAKLKFMAYQLEMGGLSWSGFLTNIMAH